MAALVVDLPPRPTLPVPGKCRKPAVRRGLRGASRALGLGSGTSFGHPRPEATGEVPDVMMSQAARRHLEAVIPAVLLSLAGASLAAGCSAASGASSSPAPGTGVP